MQKLFTGERPGKSFLKWKGIFQQLMLNIKSDFPLKKVQKAFMKETIALGMKSRPKGLQGYCLYPDCHNYNFRVQNCSGSCLKSEVLGNNELPWLWDGSAALYPSTSIKKSLGSSENILHFSEFMVNESIRIFFMTSQGYVLPVFVYS